jgi:hypothetical protein
MSSKNLDCDIPDELQERMMSRGLTSPVA